VRPVVEGEQEDGGDEDAEDGEQQGAEEKQE
jgi:hypothetical protein